MLISVSDINAASKFYGDLFGLEVLRVYGRNLILGTITELLVLWKYQKNGCQKNLQSYIIKKEEIIAASSLLSSYKPDFHNDVLEPVFVANRGDEYGYSKNYQLSNKNTGVNKKP